MSAKIKRDELGLIEGVEYKFNEDGFVDWRSMIKPQFLYVNKEWFEFRKQTPPTSIEGLEDRQLAIMLGGLKDLARIRGFKSLKYDLLTQSDSRVVVKCSMVFIGNYETNGHDVSFEEIASATVNNCDDFGLKYAESIACNRAFVRCVRGFLNINIVGFDEMDKSGKKEFHSVDTPTSLQSLPQDGMVGGGGVTSGSNAIPITPSGTLEKLVFDKFSINSFDAFLGLLREIYRDISKETPESPFLEAVSGASGWGSFEDIPAKSCRIIQAVLNGRR